LSRDEIGLILDTADSLKEISSRAIKKVPTLRGKTIVHFFHESSTRTRTSFEIAAKRLSGDTVSISASTSSIVKGETLADTARNLEAMNPDAIILRHKAAGTPHMLALNIVIAGDIAHSRVARSNIVGFTKMGARVSLVGPPTMIPQGIETLGASASYDIKEAIGDADIIMMLRIQKERQESFLFPSDREYARYFGLTAETLATAKDDVLIMHPGPINRGVEIAPEVADGPYSVILEQVANGVAVRMAILYLLLGGPR